MMHNADLTYDDSTSCMKDIQSADWEMVSETWQADPGNDEEPSFVGEGLGAITE